ncbi:MAG: S46 family peptidase, partial [Tenuifilaceae bacterium]|nr:S46 family peptidase [Tenuifilaceae bacterium]
MKRIKIFLLGLLLVLASTAKADEGMWLLPLLQKYNIGTMQSMGLELSADDIYSINNGSIKDAIVIFGGGCTGEIISDKGLLLTNHHCGYGAIQSHSSTEHDYLKDGFWAMNLDEELPTP